MQGSSLGELAKVALGSENMLAGCGDAGELAGFLDLEVDAVGEHVVHPLPLANILRSTRHRQNRALSHPSASFGDEACGRSVLGSIGELA